VQRRAQVEVEEGVGDQHDDRPRVAEHVGHLGHAVAGVDADHVRTERGDRELRDDGVRPVREPHPDAVALAHPVLTQVVAERDGAPPQLGTGHPAGLRATVDECHRVRRGRHRVGQEIGQRRPGRHDVTADRCPASSRSQPSRVPAKPSSSSIG
jgi:hypothetical protein